MSMTAGGSILIKRARGGAQPRVRVRVPLRRERTTLELEMKESGAMRAMGAMGASGSLCRYVQAQEVGQQLAILHGHVLAIACACRNKRPSWEFRSNRVALTSGSVENAVRGRRRDRHDMRTVCTACRHRHIRTHRHPAQLARAWTRCVVRWWRRSARSLSGLGGRASRSTDTGTCWPGVGHAGLLGATGAASDGPRPRLGPCCRSSQTGTEYPWLGTNQSLPHRSQLRLSTPLLDVSWISAGSGRLLTSAAGRRHLEVSVEVAAQSPQTAPAFEKRGSGVCVIVLVRARLSRSPRKKGGGDPSQVRKTGKTGKATKLRSGTPRALR